MSYDVNPERSFECPYCKSALVEIPSYENYPETAYLICWGAKHLFNKYGQLVHTYTEEHK